MLAAATQQQTEKKLESDLDKMATYLSEARAHANKQAGRGSVECQIQFWDVLWVHVSMGVGSQGGLDLKYMEERFKRGKEWVSKFMDNHHRVCHVGLDGCHADLLSWQRKEADSASSNNSLPGSLPD